MSRAAPEQMPLPFVYPAAAGRADFLVSACNRTAAGALEGWRRWPGGTLALTGPARAGKSHLAAMWAGETGAPLVAATALETADLPALAAGPLAVEDVPSVTGRRGAETALFHLLNLARAAGGPLLLTGRAEPARWGAELPDLASRLAALPVARIAAPDDAALAAVMVKLAADRGIDMPPEVVAYCARRIERSFAAAERVVAALDHASLAERRPVTRPLAAAILARDEP